MEKLRDASIQGNLSDYLLLMFIVIEEHELNTSGSNGFSCLIWSSLSLDSVILFADDG